MECENTLLLDKFRCNLDTDTRRCKAIHWAECRNLQAAAAIKKKEDAAPTLTPSETTK